MWQRTIDCLGLAVELTSELPELAPQLTAVFRTYGDAARPPAVRYRLERGAWPQLVRDGAVVSRHDEVVDLVPALELELYTQVTARTPGLVLHAGAVVGASGRALIVAGPSGAGKSTLIRALLADGLRYLTEECVALAADARCAGLARALHVDDDAIAVPPGFTCDDYVLRDAGGLRRARLFHPPAARVWRGDARAVAVIAIGHAPDAPDTLTRLSPGAALAALWPCVFRHDAGALADAGAALAASPAYRLHTRTPAAALAHVRALAQELGVAD